MTDYGGLSRSQISEELRSDDGGELYEIAEGVAVTVAVSQCSVLFIGLTCGQGRLNAMIPFKPLDLCFIYRLSPNVKVRFLWWI